MLTRPMARTGRVLRASVVLWVIIQMTAYTALLRRDCCAPAGTERPGCHEQAAPAQCPMRSADGTPCPMHRQAAQSDHAAHDAPAGTDECVMRGRCTGPIAAFLMLLKTPAILPPLVATALGPGDVPAEPAGSERAIALNEPPDTPPPQA